MWRSDPSAGQTDVLKGSFPAGPSRGGWRDWVSRIDDNIGQPGNAPEVTSAVFQKRISGFILILLLIEFLDELAFGAFEAAWPLIRDDLALSYTQIGLLLSVPGIIGNVVEPFLAVLGDVWRRRRIVCGGAVFTLALGLISVSRAFWPLMLSRVIFYPASGAFVSLSQATLMDMDEARREQNMARWTFAGSIGVVLGPLLLGLGAAVSLGWRWVIGLMAAFALVLFLIASRMPYPDGEEHALRLDARTVGRGLRDALRAAGRPGVLRWLVLLEFSDLMLDVLLGFLALYLVDVGGATPAQAGMAVAVWTGVGLLGDLALISLLERVQGLSYLRWSALLELLLFPAMLLAPSFVLKLILLGLLGFFNSGWYAILQAQLYAALPGQSGAALAVKNVSGLFAGLIPLALGLAAQHWGLGTAMWLLLAGPIALLAGLWRFRTPG